ncbi:MAG: DUF5663 domain-containing protein [Candidatus Saccharimonadales bacterium]
MAIKLDHNLLVELGLGAMPEEEKRALLSHIYETLEMRVGVRLADQMSDEQLDEFEKYFEAKDDAGAFHWLETNFPNYKQIVEEEYNKLKEEIRLSAPQILQTSQSSVSTQPVPANLTPAPDQQLANNFPPPLPTQPPTPNGNFNPPVDSQTPPPQYPGA